MRRLGNARVTHIAGRGKTVHYSSTGKTGVITACSTGPCIAFTAYKKDRAGKVTSLGVLDIPFRETPHFRKRFSELLKSVASALGEGPVLIKGAGYHSPSKEETQRVKRYIKQAAVNEGREHRFETRVEALSFGEDTNRITEVNIATAEMRSIKHGRFIKTEIETL